MSDINLDNVDGVFTYHAPSPEQLAAIANVRRAATEYAKEILRNCPRSADRTAALRKVRESMMTANAAIVLDGEV